MAPERRGIMKLLIYSDLHLEFGADFRLPEDTDGHFDTYERSGGEFRLATTGPAGGNGAYHAGGGPTSHDGRRFVFNTVEQLVPEDRNENRDVYQWFNGARTTPGEGFTSFASGPYGAYNPRIYRGTNRWAAAHRQLSGVPIRTSARLTSTRAAFLAGCRDERDGCSTKAG